MDTPAINLPSCLCAQVLTSLVHKSMVHALHQLHAASQEAHVIVLCLFFKPIILYCTAQIFPYYVMFSLFH